MMSESEFIFIYKRRERERKDRRDLAKNNEANHQIPVEPIK
jgi:hypothetical protein